MIPVAQYTNSAEMLAGYRKARNGTCGSGAAARVAEHRRREAERKESVDRMSRQREYDVECARIAAQREAKRRAAAERILNLHRLMRDHSPVIVFVSEFAEARGATYADMIGRNRSWRMSAIRFAAIGAVKKKWPEMSLPEIGRVFHRHHSLVHYALARSTPSE